jgi:hypothetical protein
MGKLAGVDIFISDFYKNRGIKVGKDTATIVGLREDSFSNQYADNPKIGFSYNVIIDKSKDENNIYEGEVEFACKSSCRSCIYSCKREEGKCDLFEGDENA